MPQVYQKISFDELKQWQFIPKNGDQITFWGHLRIDIPTHIMPSETHLKINFVKEYEEGAWVASLWLNEEKGENGEGLRHGRA